MENSRPLAVLVAIVALSNNVAARPQDFKPSRLMSSNEPGFFGASDAITSFRGDGRRDGRSFNSGAIPVQQIEEFKGQIITGPPIIGSFQSGADDNTHVVSGSYSIGTPQGVKQEIIRYKETPGLSAKSSNFKKSSGIGKVIYGKQKDRPLPPDELYIITAARREQEAAKIKRQVTAALREQESALTKRQANADKSLQKFILLKSKHN